MILRDIPGLADPHLQPPQVAEVRDPFADLRVVHLLARAPRGVPLRMRDLVDQLNAEYVDWSFSRPVVAAAILQLQANWLSDYRNSDGIAFDEDATGPDGDRRGHVARRSVDGAPGGPAARRVRAAAAGLRRRRKGPCRDRRERDRRESVQM